LAAVIAAAVLVARRPRIGHRRADLLPDPYRFQPVRGFPYLIVYNGSRPRPPILRVLHMARDLGPLLADLGNATVIDPSSQQRASQ
jgi:toxin ParE1/3/4